MTQSFPWYKSYPAGVPHEINPDRYPSIPAVLDDIAARYPDKVGYTNMDCGLTYSRTAALTKELAAYLQSLGLKPGDRVAIMMPNLLQYVIAMYACLRAGYIVVNINPLYTSREVNGTLRDSEGDHHHRELRQDTPERPARHEVRAHHHDRRRRPLPVLQAHARQLRRAQGKEDGARILAPERRRLQRSA